MNFPYLPPRPHNAAKIGLVGCGGITRAHLSGYRKMGWEVVAMCDAYEPCARERRDEFFPGAEITTDAALLLARDDVQVVDLATHPQERAALIEQSLRAGKHVLSQKPFVLDLETGERLCDLADEKGLRLAVNQNGRWAPHWSWMRAAIEAGAIGDTVATHLHCAWDHRYIKGTPFEGIHDVILYDYAIHWFDIVNTFWQGQSWKRLTAIKTQTKNQEIEPPLCAGVLIEFEGGQASLIFDATTEKGGHDSTFVSGTSGTIRSFGPNLNAQTVTLQTGETIHSPELEGAWFPDGFAGTMGELLCAIEEDREPKNSGRDNLKSLALCFAAIESSFDGTFKTPGEVRKLNPKSAPSKTVGRR